MPAAVEWIHGAEWGVALTCAAYAGALLLRARLRWLHPLLTSSAAIIILLVLTDISYEQYRIGGDLIVYLLGPATVSLGVPLYKYAKQLRESLGRIIIGVTTGSVVSIASSWLLAAISGLSAVVTYSLLPKSVSSAVSVHLSEQIGGIAELTAVLTVLTGMIGSMFGPQLLKLCRLGGDVSIGVAVGTASHGIGTARLVNDSQWQGSISALSMSLSCILTPLLMLPIYYLF